MGIIRMYNKIYYEDNFKLPGVTESVIFRLFKESPKDWREEEEDVLLEDSEQGRADFPVFPVSAFKRSFSAFNISISF